MLTLFIIYSYFSIMMTVVNRAFKTRLPLEEYIAIATLAYTSPREEDMKR
jgi:hypothetical protein